MFNVAGIVSLASVCISFNVLFFLTDITSHGLSLPSQLYLGLLLLADLGLIISAKTSSRCLLLPWLLLYLLHISLLITFFLFLVRSEDVKLETTVKDLSSDSVEEDRSKGPEDSSGYFDQMLEDVKEDPGKYFPDMKFKHLGLVFLSLAIFYIYTWIAVKSLHRNIAEARRRASSLSEVLVSRGRAGPRAYRY